LQCNWTYKGLNFRVNAEEISILKHCPFCVTVTKRQQKKGRKKKQKENGWNESEERKKERKKERKQERKKARKKEGKVRIKGKTV
jgi:hypothetical protein